LILLSLCAIALSGCDAGCASKKLPPDIQVTGRTSFDPTWPGTQSETAVNVSNVAGRQIVTITYNDGSDTGHHVSYTPMTRRVSRATTMLGWSYSTDGGSTWRHPPELAPPPGWAVLWGDPSITRDATDQRHVFIANVAIPDSKMPSSGFIDGPLGGYIGGACIARSDDGGVSFASHQCLSSHGDFYDGSSMAAGGSALFDRGVYAAFSDLNSKEVVVWRSPTETGTFTQLPNPFPGMEVGSHPLLRDDGQSLYVGALSNSDGRLYLNRYSGGSWGRAIVASLPVAAYVGELPLADRKLRFSHSFSFDVGASSQEGDDGVRVLYTERDPNTQRYYVRGTRCRVDLLKCTDTPGWGTTPGNFRLRGQQFSPNVRAFPGFFGLAPVWKATYLSTDDDPNGNSVSVKEGNLVITSNGTPLFIPFNLVDSLLVCPDLRDYWGDYQDLGFAGFGKDSTTARFVYAHTDSSSGCLTRWEYTSNRVHVSAVFFK
jgi:hypothetical protein